MIEKRRRFRICAHKTFSKSVCDADPAGHFDYAVRSHKFRWWSSTKESDSGVDRPPIGTNANNPRRQLNCGMPQLLDCLHGKFGTALHDPNWLARMELERKLYMRANRKLVAEAFGQFVRVASNYVEIFTHLAPQALIASSSVRITQLLQRGFGFHHVFW